MSAMGLFSRHSSTPGDLRDRDYVLTGCPLVAEDDYLVLVDATVRLAVRQPTEDRPLVRGYNPADEPALHAVCVTVLRLMAESLPAEELLAGRGRVAETIERGLRFAPVGTDLEARVVSVEVRSYDPPPATFSHEFRVVTT